MNKSMLLAFLLCSPSLFGMGRACSKEEQMREMGKYIAQSARWIAQNPGRSAAEAGPYVAALACYCYPDQAGTVASFIAEEVATGKACFDALRIIAPAFELFADHLARRRMN